MMHFQCCAGAVVKVLQTNTALVNIIFCSTFSLPLVIAPRCGMLCSTVPLFTSSDCYCWNSLDNTVRLFCLKSKTKKVYGNSRVTLWSSKNTWCIKANSSAGCIAITCRILWHLSFFLSCNVACTLAPALASCCKICQKQMYAYCHYAAAEPQMSKPTNLRLEERKDKSVTNGIMAKSKSNAWKEEE